VRRLPLRQLVSSAPGPDRIFFTSTWFRGHNNPRYAELLPRLDRLDAYLFVCSDQRLLRGLQVRALGKTRTLRYRLMFERARRRYRSLFIIDREQIAYFDGPILADIDDTVFSGRELQLLNRPNVVACVVTNQRLARRYEELGVRKPYHVIPQGVSLSAIDADKVREVARRHRNDSDDQVVVGYMAAWLLAAGDRGGEIPLFNVDHLLELWEDIRSRVPNARLWLLGGVSQRVRRRCDGRDDIVLFGRIPREEVLSYVANFDIALYPRTADQGFQSVKIAEYMGCGIPTVSYDYEVTADLREAGAGLLAATGREFVEAVERLSLDKQLRMKVAAAARAAGAARDWDVLSREYRRLLDHYL
jgi:glycosyltransferase involved in cell wall biosynthesis